MQYLSKEATFYVTERALQQETLVLEIDLNKGLSDYVNTIKVTGCHVKENGIDASQNYVANVEKNIFKVARKNLDGLKKNGANEITVEYQLELS